MTDKRRIRAYYIAPEKRVAGPITITDDLDTLHRLIDCECIDIRPYRVGGSDYDFIFDDEFLCHERPPMPSVADEGGCIILMGNVLITGLPDEDGEQTSLTDEDIRRIERRMMSVPVPDADDICTLCLSGSRREPSAEMSFAIGMLMGEFELRMRNGLFKHPEVE